LKKKLNKEVGVEKIKKKRRRKNNNNTPNIEQLNSCLVIICLKIKINLIVSIKERGKKLQSLK